jgi:hypothetical protein
MKSENQLLKFIPQSNPKYSGVSWGDSEFTDLEILEIAYEEKMSVCLLNCHQSVIKQLAYNLQLPYMYKQIYDASDENLFDEEGNFLAMAKIGGIFAFEEMRDITHLRPLTKNPKEYLKNLLETSTEFFCICLAHSTNNEKELWKFDIVLDYLNANVESIKDPLLLELMEKLRGLYPHQIQTFPSIEMLKQLQSQEKLFGPEVAKQIFINKFEESERKIVESYFKL